MSKTASITTAILCGFALMGMGAHLMLHSLSAGVAFGGIVMIGLGLGCLSAGGIAIQWEA